MLIFSNVHKWVVIFSMKQRPILTDDTTIIGSKAHESAASFYIYINVNFMKCLCTLQCTDASNVQLTMLEIHITENLSELQ